MTLTTAQLDELEAFLNLRDNENLAPYADLITNIYRPQDSTTLHLRASVLRELLALGRRELADDYTRSIP